MGRSSRFCLRSAAVLLGAGFAFPAQAAECSLHILSSVSMQSTADHTVMVVPVTVNNTSKRMLLDTGSRITQLSKATVQAMGLPQSHSDERTFDLAGNISSARAAVGRFSVGAHERKGLTVNVAPNPELGTSLPYDGLLARDLFADADLDMDFGANQFTAFSPDHCDGKVVYWAADNVAIVPVTERRGLITFPVTVNGHQMNAVMDTGAQFSIMNMNTAKDVFDLTPQSADMKPLTQTSGEWTLTSYGHHFDDLSFEGVQVKNLRIYLMPDQMTSHDKMRHLQLEDPLGLGLRQDVDRNVAVPDLIIGMDVLRHLHIYYATKEKRLYITDAISGQSALFGYKS